MLHSRPLRKLHDFTHDAAMQQSIVIKIQSWRSFKWNIIMWKICTGVWDVLQYHCIKIIIVWFVFLWKKNIRKRKTVKIWFSHLLDLYAYIYVYNVNKHEFSPKTFTSIPSLKKFWIRAYYIHILSYMWLFG